MDSIKSLLENKQYDLVLKCTENATDSVTLFYRISALLALGKAEDCLACINNNKKELQKNLAVLIKIHIEVLCILKRFDEAYEEMEYYENLPYESQIVEETLKKYRREIRMAEKEAVCSKNLTVEDIAFKLKSEKAAIVIDGLQSIREKDVNLFMTDIERIMISYPMQAIRSFALMLLVEKKVNKSVKFLHVDEQILVNPSLLEPPFVDNSFMNFVRLIQEDFKNPTLSQNATSIYSTYIIFNYPDKDMVNQNVMLCALYAVANEYLKSSDEKELSDKCIEKGVELKEVKKIIEKLKESIEIF